MRGGIIPSIHMAVPMGTCRVVAGHVYLMIRAYMSRMSISTTSGAVPYPVTLITVRWAASWVATGAPVGSSGSCDWSGGCGCLRFCNDGRLGIPREQRNRGGCFHAGRAVLPSHLEWGTYHQGGQLFIGPHDFESPRPTRQLTPRRIHVQLQQQSGFSALINHRIKFPLNLTVLHVGVHELPDIVAGTTPGGSPIMHRTCPGTELGRNSTGGTSDGLQGLHVVCSLTTLSARDSPLFQEIDTTPTFLG